MSSIEFLSTPENRDAVRAVIQEILSEIEPDELAVAERYIDPLIDTFATDNVGAASAAQREGGLGPIDLIVTLVVPITVGVLTHLLKKFGESLIQELAKKLARKSEAERLVVIKEVVIIEVDKVITQSKSRRGKKRSKAITSAVTSRVTKLLTTRV